MKKLTLSTLAFLMLSSTVVAQDHSENAGKVYIVLKALMSTTASVQESPHISIASDVGGGIGFDIGYTLPYNFALELDTSYSKNRVKESDTSGHGHTKEADATYWTYAFDVTYTLPLSHSWALMGKLGYEFEHESISDLHVEADDSGVVYGAGLEYHLSDHYQALVEYEASTIDSPRGASIYAGVKYIF